MASIGVVNKPLTNADLTVSCFNLRDQSKFTGENLDLGGSVLPLQDVLNYDSY